MADKQEVKPDVTFGVYIPSVGRYERGVVTGKWFENPHHVVRKSQEHLYREHGFENLVAVEDSLINSYSKVYNWIVENAPEDIVAIVDDDVKNFVYRLEYNYGIEDFHVSQAEFERLAQLIYDLDIGLAFGSATPTPYGYTSEFGWYGIPGAFKVVNRQAIKAKMDTMLQRNTDIDYVLTELLKNRICLNAKYLVDNPVEDEITNVTGSSYDVSKIEASVTIMKTRWGKYFEYNPKKNVPVIRVDR